MSITSLNVESTGLDISADNKSTPILQNEPDNEKTHKPPSSPTEGSYSNEIEPDNEIFPSLSGAIIAPAKSNEQFEVPILGLTLTVSGEPSPRTILSVERVISLMAGTAGSNEKSRENVPLLRRISDTATPSKENGKEANSGRSIVSLIGVEGTGSCGMSGSSNSAAVLKSTSPREDMKSLPF